MKSHDKVDQLGFDAPIQQLAHDLAIAKLANNKSLVHEDDGFNTDVSKSITWTELDQKYFDRYKQWYDHFLKYLDDQTRYDSASRN